MEPFLIFYIVVITLIAIIVVVGKRNNQADWGHWGTNILDGWIRVYCRKFHRQKDQLIDLPENESLILAPNHISGIDPFILITATRRPIRFMIAKEEYDKPILHWMFKSAGCIPVDRSGRMETAFRSVLREIRKGEIVSLFPQGGIHSDKTPRLKIKPGIIKLSALSQTSIMPIKISGVGSPGNITSSLITRSNIELEWLQPFSPEEVQTEKFRDSFSAWLINESNSVES